MRERLRKIHSASPRSAACLVALVAAACSAPPTEKAQPPAATAPAASTTAPAAPEAAPAASGPPPVPATRTPAPAAPATRTLSPAAEPAPKPVSPLTAAPAHYRAAAWNELPGWRNDNVSEAWSAFLASCGAIGGREAWRETCAAATRIANPGADAARRFFERHLIPYEVQSEGGDGGLITGYYEPLLRGSRKPSARYRYALFGVPDDLLVVDLAQVYPELKGMRVRGRVEGRRVVPYYDRAQIENGQAPVRGKELVWVDDAIDLFFLHVQGSGRVLLDSGETIRVAYAEHNGHPYRSIGRLLVERGELALEQASMQGIKAWAREHPARASELLNANASYVFFRELPQSRGGPPGSLGVPLTARRSVAVDPRYVPLGVPVYLATTWPNSTRPLNRLMLAQDTGGAIRGPVRADFFWGYGEAAAREAGRMKQRLRMWVLLPAGHSLPVPGAPK